MNRAVPGAAQPIVGRTPVIDNLRRLIEKASRNRLPVLLLGESGTGKEVVARAIHDANPRGQFVPIDCGSLVGTLMESELFGHVKGSFSGAQESKKGLVEVADGGTAFFDEIGDLPLEMQVKLLRLIQERQFRAVGALQWRSVDLRIIAATHRDLKAEIAKSRFREDLYFRLNVFSIRLPPLRDRKADIPLLVDHFLERAHAAGLPWFDPGPQTRARLAAYDWPGNVRELKNAVERMAALHSEHHPEAALPSALVNQSRSAGLERVSAAVAVAEEDEAGCEFVVRPKSPVFTISESERNAIERALAAANGERGKTARLLGMGRTTLYRKMKEYGLD
ncbi:MAG: sigma-54 dependent transcriptional regulator [Bryobacteraceae bacterium]|jgi:DNA-binding NtrC family response regulator